LRAQVDGYSHAFTWGAGLVLASAVITAVFIKVRKEDLPAGEAVAAAG
jgi:hypothetical protein